MPGERGEFLSLIHIYLYLHGGTSCLYFYGETYTVDQMYDDLGELTVHGKVFLNLSLIHI